MGFSDFMDASIAVVMIAPNGQKIGINYSIQSEPGMLEQAYKLLEEKCPGLESHRVKISIVGGMNNRRIQNLKIDETSFDDDRETLSRKIGDSGVLISEVIQFARPKEFEFTHSRICNPNTPASFVIDEKGIKPGRALIVNPESENKRVLIFLGIVDQNIMNISFHSLKEKFKPIIFSPHFVHDGNNAINSLYTFTCYHNIDYDLHKLFHVEMSQPQSLTVCARVGTALTNINDDVRDVMKKWSDGLTLQMAEKDGVKIIKNNDGYARSVKYTLKAGGGMPKSCSFPEPDHTIVPELIMSVRTGKLPFAIGDDAIAWNAATTAFICDVTPKSRQRGEGPVIVKSIGTPREFKVQFIFNYPECYEKGSKALYRRMAENSLDPAYVRLCAQKAVPAAALGRT